MDKRPTTPDRPDIERDASYLRIGDLEFYKTFATSLGRKYTLAWSSQHRFYILLAGDEIVTERPITHPRTGCVADTGALVICDGRDASALEETFYALDPKGSILIRQTVLAPIELAWIAPDGRYAAYHTGDVDDWRADRQLSFFELSGRRRHWQHRLPGRSPESLSVLETEKDVVVQYRDGQQYRFSLDGVFHDKERHAQSQLNGAIAEGLESRFGYALMSLAGSLLREIEAGQRPATEYARVDSVLQEALNRSLSNNWIARAYRIRGEVAEKEVRLTDAINFYDKALSFNPRVGVQMRLAGLAQEAGIDPPPAAKLRRLAANSSAWPYKVMAGRRSLVITDSLKTRHTPGVLGLTPDGKLLWGPARSPYITCQDSRTPLWKTHLDARVRAITCAAGFIYVVTGDWSKYEGSLLVLDERGRQLARFALAGFASTIAVDPSSGRALVASGNGERAIALVIDGPQLISELEINTAYNWMDVGLLATGQWVINCRDTLLILTSDGNISSIVTPPPYLETVTDFAFTSDIATGPGNGEARAAYALLGVTPPVPSQELKTAFRRKVLEWHPDRNPSPRATAMTRELINAYNTASRDVGADQSHHRKGEISSRQIESPDTIRRLVIDEHTGEAVMSCGSGIIFRLEDGALVKHWTSKHHQELLYSRSGGSSLIVSDGDSISTLPAGATVASHPSIRNAFAMRVRGSASLGKFLIFSGDSRELFVGTSSLLHLDHLNFSNPVRDVLIDNKRKRLYIASGGIYVGTYDENCAPNTDAPLAPLRDHIALPPRQDA